MRHKLPLKRAAGQFLVIAAALSTIACQHEARTVLVEAETTATTTEAAPAPVDENTAPPNQPAEEIVIIESPSASPGPAAGPEPLESEPAAPESLELETVPEAGPEALEDSLQPAPRTLPPGTRIELELKTPLHTATTLVGDRFAARVAVDVALGESVLVPARSLVEGRIERVIAADDAGPEEEGATIGLEFSTLQLPSGERIPLHADLVGDRDPVTEGPRDEGGDRVAGAARGAASGAVLGTIFGGGARSTVIGAVLGGVAGATIVAPAPDREVIVPSGTRLVIVLTEPLRLSPAAAPEAS